MDQSQISLEYKTKKRTPPYQKPSEKRQPLGLPHFLVFHIRCNSLCKLSAEHLPLTNSNSCPGCISGGITSLIARILASASSSA